MTMGAAQDPTKTNTRSTPESSTINPNHIPISDAEALLLDCIYFDGA